MSQETNSTDLLLKIQKVSNIIERNRSKLLADLGLTDQQFKILKEIEQMNEAKEHLNMVNLGNKLGLGKAAASRLTGRMEEDGLLIKDVRYGTKSSVVLTNQGKSKLKKAKEIIQSFDDAILMGCTDNQKNQLEKILNRFRIN